MRRFVLPLAALIALGLSAGTAKAQLIISTPYTGYYSSGYLSVAPSTSLYVTPSVVSYGSYYPSYSSSYYYPSYSSSYYSPSYSYGSYYSTPYWGSSYYPSSYYSGYYGSRSWDGWGGRRGGWGRWGRW
jgi:hypothetical protein